MDSCVAREQGGMSPQVIKRWYPRSAQICNSIGTQEDGLAYQLPHLLPPI